MKNFHYAWCEPITIKSYTSRGLCDFRPKHCNTLFGLCLEKIISQIIFAKSVSVFENWCNIENNRLIDYLSVIKECVPMNFNVDALLHVRSLRKK